MGNNKPLRIAGWLTVEVEYEGVFTVHAAGRVPANRSVQRYNFWFRDMNKKQDNLVRIEVDVGVCGTGNPDKNVRDINAAMQRAKEKAGETASLEDWWKALKERDDEARDDLARKLLCSAIDIYYAVIK